MMSELDGVTLSQSDIWVAYRDLQKQGFISATTAEKNLVMKLTPEGDTYCRQVIYPELFEYVTHYPSMTDSEIEEILDNGEHDVLDNLKGFTIPQINELMIESREIAKRVASRAAPEGSVSEGSREALRKAVMQLSLSIEDLKLPNFENSQAQSLISVLMVLIDTPVISKKDFGYFLGLVADTIGVASFAWVAVQAIRGYSFIT